MTDVTSEQVADFVAGHDFTPEVWCEGRSHGPAPQRAVWYGRIRCCGVTYAYCPVCVGQGRRIARRSTLMICPHCETRVPNPTRWDVDVVELIRIKGAS